MYEEYQHDSSDVFEACGIEEQLVVKIRSKIHTDIQSCKSTSEVVEKIERGLIDEESGPKLIRPVSLLLAQNMINVLKQESIMEALAKSISKFREHTSGDDDDDMDLEIPREKLKDYCKRLLKSHTSQTTKQ